MIFGISTIIKNNNNNNNIIKTTTTKETLNIYHSPVLVALATTVGYKENQEKAVCFEDLTKMAVLVE
jgi:hypothetical protein